MEHALSPILFLILVIAFLAEYVDSSLGMGYGTTLTPILLLLGYEPMQVIPAVLLSELLSGILAGAFHHCLGNVELLPKNFSSLIRKKGLMSIIRQHLPLHLKIVLVISSCSILGTISAVILAVNVPSLWLTIYIGTMVLTIGIVILLSSRKPLFFSWKRIVALGLVASFNKGMSGGGYGPVVTGGQLLAGVKGRNAVAITSMSEGLTCLVGVVLYFLTREAIDWSLAPFLAVGSILSVPFAAFTVKYLRTRYLRLTIGVTTLILGIATLFKAFH